MRATLQVLVEELRRLKGAGVSTVPASEEGLAALRAAVARLCAQAPAGSSGTLEPGPMRPEATPAASARAEPRIEKKTTKTAEPVLPPPPSFALPEGDRAAQWAWLRERVEGDEVCRARVRPGKKVVLGVGSLEARIFFCGEAPGAEEEVQGEPFVGPAGQLLTRMIEAMGLARSDVYIGNIMNWRPDLPTPPGLEQTGNRPPTPEEMGYCLPYLRAQLSIVKPELIVALGSTAAQGLLGVGSFKTLGEIRGRWHAFEGTPLMVTYHPSYILRNPTNRSKRAIWEDLLQVMERAGLPISEKQQRFFLAKGA
jgi:DNA polymerase